MKKFVRTLVTLACLILFNPNPASAQQTPPDPGPAPAPCTPSCDGKECGPDSCGGVCGSCDGGKECIESAGKCYVPAPDPLKADGEDCTANDECENGLCNVTTGKCAVATAPKPTAPKPASKTVASKTVACDPECDDTHYCNSKGECITDPCLDLPFSDGDDYGCRVAAAVDLRMPRTIPGVRAVLLRKSEKALETYQKALETLTRYYMWQVFDYFVDCEADYKDPESENYWDNSDIRTHLQANPTNLEIMANARLGLPHGLGTIPFPFGSKGKVKIILNRD